jgi:hypothetical protein
MIAKLEGNSTEDESEKHDHDRDIKSGKENAVKKRKGSKKHPAQNNKPCLIILPDALEACHHYISFFLITGEKSDHSYAQIKTVGNGII